VKLFKFRLSRHKFSLTPFRLLHKGFVLSRKPPVPIGHALFLLPQFGAYFFKLRDPLRLRLDMCLKLRIFSLMHRGTNQFFAPFLDRVSACEG
jgi:hypothetical protein